jgi:predicted metal-dependent HD superfamily phosphohydrolase
MHDSIGLGRWHRLMTTLGLATNDVVYHQLMAAYGEPQRHYHSFHHLAACLEHLDRVKALLKSPAEVELALWFHDAVYQPRSSSNEVDSAAWLRAFLEESWDLARLGGDRPVVEIERMCQHVLATQHHQKTVDPDRQFLLDIDLAILGSPVAKFEQFEQDIRREYAWVPWQLYCQKRLQVLSALLGLTEKSVDQLSSSKNFIYQTAYFQEQYEALARHNLRRRMMILQGFLA